MDQLSLPDRATSANNDPSPGALVNVYNQGTTDRATIYADEGAAAQHTNPVVCNGSGVIPQIFYDGGEDLEVVITTAAGVTLRTFDPVALIDDGTLPDGTEAEPGIRFTDDPDTGFRRAGANDMRAVTGGADVAAFTSTGLDVTGAISVDGNPLFGTRDLASFGVTGSGDEDVALEAALQWSAAEKGRKLIGGKIEQVRITRLISATGHVQVDLSGVTIVKTTEAARIRWLNPPLANQPLSGSYTAGDTTIDVDDLGAAYEAGTPFHIGSDAVDPANRDSGSASSQYRVTEIGFLGTGSTNATLQLDSPLRRTAGISPTSTAGDEARIDPYTTAPDTELNPRVMIYNAATNVDVVLPNVEAPAGEDWASSAMFTFSGYVGGNIYLGKITRGYGPYLLLNGTVNVTVHEGLVQNLRNAPSDGAFGYGIENRGYGTRINGLNGSETRHLYTTNTIAIPANSTDADTRFATGRVEAFQVIGGAATGGDLAPWDTHHCADGGLFDNNVTMSSRGTAHLVRGRGVTVRNPAITGAVAIGQVLTEFNDGSPDDDLYTAGKTRDDISEAIFDGIFAEGITGPAYKANHGVLTLTGGGRVTTSHQTALENEGGIVNVQDAPVFVMGGAGENGEAIIKTTGVASQMSAVSGLGFTYINADMTIDARGITATGVVGISCAAGTTTVVRGDLTLILPDGATLFSTTGTIITEGRGRILYRIDGTGTLNTDSHPGAVVRRTTTETWGGPLTPQDFGATDDGTTDYSAAIQAMFDASRDTGTPWRMEGRYNVASTELTCYTSGDGSLATLVTTAGGQTNPALTFAPLAANRTEEDATLLAALNAQLPFTKGQARVDGLSAYVGQAIKYVSPDSYIERSSGATYRHELFFRVLDADGRIDPPIPYDVPDTVTFTIANREVMDERIDVWLPTIEVSSGSTDRPGNGPLFRFDRSNMVIYGGRVSNLTTAKVAQLLLVESYYGLTFYDTDMSGARVDSTNYGFNVSGSRHHFENCTSRDCRRGWDGTYTLACTINGGTYDGVGGHQIFGLKVDGAYLRPDKAGTEPGTSPVKVAGADLEVTNCTMTSRSMKPFVQVREDVPELIGQASITNNHLVMDVEGATTSTDVDIFALTDDTYDPGRDLAWPQNVLVADNFLEIRNAASWTGKLREVVMVSYSGLTGSRNGIFNSVVTMRNNTAKADAVEPARRYAFAKGTNATGSGVVVNISDAPNLEIDVVGLAAGAADTTTRVDIYGERIGTLDLTVGGGVVRDYQINCKEFSTTVDGTTALQGDEKWWHAINGGAARRIVVVADDAAFSWPSDDTSEMWEVYQRNGGTTPARAVWVADHVGTSEVDILSSANETFTASTSVLAGTTGTDGEVTISGNSGTNYIENRSGSTLSLTLVKR